MIDLSQSASTSVNSDDKLTCKVKLTLANTDPESKTAEVYFALRFVHSKHVLM